MSDVVEVKRWKNEILGISVWMIKVKGKFYFFGKEVASALGYTDPKKTILDRVDPEEKKGMEEILGVNFRRVLERNLIKSDGDKKSLSDFFQRIHKNQKLLTEFALYHFCANSKKDKAKPFHKWVFNTIMKIRETGSYTLPGGAVDNPLDLLDRVKTLEKKLQSQQEKSFISRGIQTQESISKNSLKKFKSKLEKSIRSLKKEIDRVESELRESIREINSSCSSSSNLHSSNSE